jgi:hypothetical protein
MEALWNRINRTRNEFRDFICYEWNYLAHLNFHRNYETSTERIEKLIKGYLRRLRRTNKLTFSAFYIIPKSNVNPIYNPHHVHILFLIYNSNYDTATVLEYGALKYKSINKCIVSQLDNQEVAINYLTKNKNLKLTNRYHDYHYDFFREQLLKKYSSPTDYINDVLRLGFRERYLDNPKSYLKKILG